MHVGSVLPDGICHQQAVQSVGGTSGKGKLAPHLKVDLKLVGIVVLHSEIVEDDVDALADNLVLLTPTLMRELVPCCAFVTETADQGRWREPQRCPRCRPRSPAIPTLKASGLISSEVVTSPFVATAERADRARVDCARRVRGDRRARRVAHRRVS